MKLERPLTRDELPAYWAERGTLFAAEQADLSAVEQLDSVGLAFLVQWSQALASAGKGLTLLSPPASFYPLADLYGVGSLFELTDNPSGSKNGSE
ncbi:STAS domain-containing protein [Zobellella iuensis]|uniref:STAS domain-containing protein n=1 Tax=Zobellella iuensis TaxID=2803811 RepID=A0ABS1QPE5_9GAMM|nr:STAS domain-containing protein [Zobellella iuensis]MBL1376738.1 STAS domain-containing protein [Zobellella iuensis]